ncbi:MAG: response regulator transcription factor [Nitrospirae bacterium]|nr:response regulator transcription factor [Nitrospirota bacterium]
MLRVLLADDSKIMRECLRTLLDRHPEIKVISEAEDGRVAVRLVKELFPDIVIMGTTMPDLNGIETIRQIVAELPGIRVIALSMYSDRRFVSEVFKAGASAFLLKDCIYEDLVPAISGVAAFGTYLSPDISDDI